MAYFLAFRRVDVIRFELTASASLTQRSTKLSHTSKCFFVKSFNNITKRETNFKCYFMIESGPNTYYNKITLAIRKGTIAFAWSQIFAKQN